VNRAEFEAAFAGLLEERQASTENTGCVACTACERCVDCTFCKGSTALVRSHYCVDSTGLVDCTHCHKSRELLACNHCVASERCTRSAYVVRSTDCDGCTYCFGCVGLSKKEFHILNRPYDKSSYFALTAKLMRELGLASGASPRDAAPARPAPGASQARRA
jgi:hypothetical protein